MPDRGKIVVSFILLVALGLAVFAWYWRWQQGHRAAEFWGAQTSQLIRGARQTELLVLEPADEQVDPLDAAAAETEEALPVLSINGQRYQVAATYDLASTPGLIHARHSLTEDASFHWDQSVDACDENWTHAMRLAQDGRSTVLVFDFRCKKIYDLEQGKTISVLPRIAEGFERIVERAEAAVGKQVAK